MNTIQTEIKIFFKKYNINNYANIYLVGFSGGPDSMCLLHILHNICPQNRIIAIHLNHNWRGEESDQEEKNCADFCKNLGIEFYSERIDVAATETAAREARYDFFKRCSEKFNSKIIFTAHNKNDNAETLIFRICHGTGVSGLQGIAPKRDIYYRPLLNISRAEIENYCKENNLKVNIDSSNFDTIHKRNLIRTKIFPLLSQINPNILDSVQSLSEIAQEETEILQEYTFNVLKNISDNKGKIKTKEFLKLSNALQKRILYEILIPKLPQNYDRTKILNIWNFIKENITSKSGKTISVTTNCWIYASEKNIELITNMQSEKTEIRIAKTEEYKYGKYTVNISECDRIPDEGFGNDSYTVFVDLSGINNLDKLVIRNRKDGDIIQPLGMQGTQKLKKYLNSKKIPNHEKDNLLFLAQDKEILWAVGFGLSEKIKVKSKPTHKITIKEG